MKNYIDSKIEQLEMLSNALDPNAKSIVFIDELDVDNISKAHASSDRTHKTFNLNHLSKLSTYICANLIL